MIKPTVSNEFIMDGQMLAKNAIKKMQKAVSDEKMFPDGVQESYIPKDKFMLTSPQFLQENYNNARKYMDMFALNSYNQTINPAALTKKAEATVGEKLDIVSDGHFWG